MRTGFLLTMSLCLLGLNCTSSTRPMGGTGGEEESGGSGGGSPGTGGSKTGGSGGSKSGGAGGGSATGGSGGAATGGSGGSTGTGGATGGSGGATGGSGGVTGGSGGATGGSGGAGGGSAGGCNMATVCEDFEKQTMGAEPKEMYAVVKTAAATLTVDNMKAYSGTQALHIHLNGPVPGDTKGQLAFTAPVLPYANNDVHGRAMVWLSRNPGNHWDFVTAFGTDQPQDDDTKIQYTIGSMSGHMMAVYQPGDDSVDSTTQFPVARWGCLQWEFKGAADGTHLLKMMLDGKVVDKGEITKGGIAKSNWPATTWKSMKVGWINFGGAGAAIDMWIDDLAVGNQEIPCPPAK
jgi:hypothetical protein